MALKRVGSLPEAGLRAKRGSYVGGDVREFCRNRTYDVAEVTVEGKTAKQLDQALRKYVKEHPEQCAGVGVAKRRGRVYLYRKG